MDKLMWSLKDVAKVVILNARFKLAEGHLQLVVIFGYKIDVHLPFSADAEK